MATKGENRGGRPPLPPGEAKSVYLQVRMRPDEIEYLRKVAASEGQSVSDFVRERVFAIGVGAD